MYMLLLHGVFYELQRSPPIVMEGEDGSSNQYDNWKQQSKITQYVYNRAALRRVLNDLCCPSVGSSWPALSYAIISQTHAIIVP